MLWLTAGHELHLIADDVRLDALALLSDAAKRAIDVVDTTPGFAEQTHH